MEKVAEGQHTSSSRKARIALPSQNLSAQAAGVAAPDPATANSLQRTFGNRALERMLPRAPANRIQRVGGTGTGGGQSPLLLADRPWNEIEEEEAKTGKRAKPKEQLLLADRPWKEIAGEEAKTGKRAKPKGQLLLADRPWSEIEPEQKTQGLAGGAFDARAAQEAKVKEGAQALFRGDNKDEWGREKKPFKPAKIDKAFFQKPLQLADRPWEEVALVEESEQKEFVTKLSSRLMRLLGHRDNGTIKQQILDFEKAYLANAAAKKRFKSKERRRTALDELSRLEGELALQTRERERKDRQTKRKQEQQRGRSQAVGAFTQNVDTARQQPGGTQYQSELNEIDKKYSTAGSTRFAQGSAGWQAASESDLFFLRAKHVAAFKRNKAITELKARIALLKNGVLRLRERHTIARNDGKVNARKLYFGATVPAWVDHNTKLGNMQARLHAVDSRAAFLQSEIDAIESDTEDSSTVNSANADLASTNDQPLLNYATLEQEMHQSEQSMMDIALLRTAREALLPAYQGAPDFMNNTVLAWLRTKVGDKPDLDPAGYDLEVRRKLQVQYEIAGGFWLRNILNFNFVVRPGLPTLYLLDLGHITLNNKQGGGTTNYNVHLSVFANTITDARISCIDTPANIVDRLIASNTDELQAAHVTLELWDHGHWPTNWNGNPNPHCYRGGPSVPKALARKTNDDWATVVRPALRLKLTNAIANFQPLVQNTVNTKGDAGFPLAGSLS